MNGARPLARLVVALVLLSPSAGAATLVNPSFETGFAGWSLIGDTTIQTAAFGIAPTDGSSMALLSTLGGAEGAPPFGDLPGGSGSGFGGRFVPFLELSPEELSQIRHPHQPGMGFAPIGQNAGIKQTIVGQAGDVLSLDFNYITEDGADFALVELIPADGSPKVLTFLALDFQALPPSPVALCARTVVGCQGVITHTSGWLRFTQSLPSSGAFDLVLGMWEGVDGLGPSAVLFDNVQLTAGAVPAPAGWLLGALVATAATWAVRRRRGIRRCL